MKKKLLFFILGLLVWSNAFALNLSRVKNWSSGEILTHTDLNAEFNNILDHAIANADVASNAAILASKLDFTVASAIGSTTPSTGAFTTLSSTGDTTLGNGATDDLTLNFSDGITYTPAATWTFTGAQTVSGTWANLGTVTTADINGGTIDGVTIGGAVAPTITNLGTVTTADINGGTIDGVTIGGASAGAGTFTTLAANGNTTLGDGADSITFNSSSGITYTPAATWTFTGAQTVSGTWANLGTVTTADINGGTIDGVTIGGAVAPTITNLGTVTTADINGGTIDGVTIGGASAGAGTFTTLTTSGNNTLNGLTASKPVFTDASKILVSTGTLGVDQGGTGATTLTDGGILLGSGTGAVTALGVATDGQIPIGDGTTDPVLATLTGTASEVDVTNGAGTITIGLVDPLSTAKGGTGATATVNTANGVVVLDASGYVPDNSVDTGALKTSTGEVSKDAGWGAVVLPGGSYGFWPQIKNSTTGNSNTEAYFWQPGLQDPGTTYTSRLALSGYGSVIIYAQQQYVTSSGEDLWIFLLIDKITKDIVFAWAAEDHPAYGNGGNFETLSHPFSGYDAAKHEIVLLDKETCLALKAESKQKNKSILTLVNEEYQPDMINEQVYQPLHSGKYIDENGKHIKQMVETIPDYIKVRKLLPMTAQDKLDKIQRQEQKANDLKQTKLAKENKVKAKLNLNDKELEELKEVLK